MGSSFDGGRYYQTQRVFLSLCLSVVLKEANQVAHHVAKLSMDGNLPTNWLVNKPDSLVRLLSIHSH